MSKKNYVDEMADNLVEVMKFVDSEVDYPDFDLAKKDDGVIAEWFYPIMNGDNDFSELTAINMYVGQKSMFEEIGELMLGIGLTEMKHYGKLMEFVIKIGGKVDQKHKGSGVRLGSNAKEAIQIAIDGERKTIDFYEELKSKILSIPESKTTEIALKLLSKLIADELIHLKLLRNKIDD